MIFIGLSNNAFFQHGHDSRKCVFESIKANESFVSSKAILIGFNHYLQRIHFKLQNAVYSVLAYSNSKRVDSVYPHRKKSNSKFLNKQKLF